MSGITARVVAVWAMLLGTAGYLAVVTTAEPIAAREPLASCPLMIGDWDGERAPDFDEKTLQILGVDDYINRVYRNADRKPVGLYVGFYGSQRQGDTMHSPLNCLPGAGWSPVSFSRIDVPVEADANTSIHINRYVIEKGLDRQLVLYWYQSQGRVVASEYAGKMYLVLDAIRHNRTDGALVRVISPITGNEVEAERVATRFVQQIYPLLGQYLPS